MDKVLIAEDDKIFRTLIKTYLEKYKDVFEIIMVSDGFEAIEVLKKERISLLVTDLKMPRVEGLVLLAYMNKNFPNIPCIVMTSLRSPRLKKMIKKDVLFYIEKPFKTDELANAIKRALDIEELEGYMQGISIVSFLQLIYMEEKTCVCEVETDNKEKGVFYFRNGVLFDALYRDLKGKEAAIELIKLEQASINFKNLPEEKKRKRIKTEITALIMEAMRQKDEEPVS